MNPPAAGDTVLPAAVTERFAGHPLLDGLAGALDASRFLARALSLDEELAAWILAHPASRGYVEGALAGAVEAPLAAAMDSEALYVELRRQRRRSMCLVAWADLAGVYTLRDTLAALSELADTLIDAALATLYRELGERHGVPRGRDSGEAVPMVVLGLGKLGGRELNFSSDVDLIFCFTEGGETDGPRALSNEEFFLRLGRQLVRMLDEPSADGFVFRTDMRLRPNGGSGPLALSFGAMEHYYQAHGRDWERYAMIKARVVAGDRRCGAELLALLRPFVYRKYLDFSAFESIREMKTLINRELARKGRRNDIKLGPGGIREIEFVVQSHQLIRGGRERDLQTGSLYAAFDALVRLQVIEAEERDRLLDAYAFLRNTEHRLQMFDDQQTQQLPTDEAGRARLATAMGFADYAAFAAALSTHREQVQASFSRLFQTEETPADDELDGFADVWFATRSEQVCTAFLAEHGFADPGQALSLVRGVREGRVYQGFSRNGRERLDRMLPAALKEIARARAPDRSLVRFIQVIEGIGHRSAYFALLAENALALRQLVQLIGTSAWVARWIGQHPVILDELLDPIANTRLEPVEQIAAELHRRLQPMHGDMEAQMDGLREYKNGYFLRVAALAIAGALEPLAVRRGLSDLASAVIGEVVSVARASLSSKVRTSVEGIEEQLLFGVVGYGKFGGAELSYQSDLDLVFLFDAVPAVAAEMAPSLGYYHSRLAQRITHVLNTTTRAGVLYETDLRLRPSGHSGTMVSSVRAFADYQQQQAWTWEHQALVRSRMVDGPALLRERFEAIRARILCRRRDPLALGREVVDMRRRMSEANSRSSEQQFDLKLGEGGLVDIEFLAQYHVLARAADCPQVLAPRGTIEILGALAEAGIMEAGEAAMLQSACREYLALELELRLEERPALIDADASLNTRKDVIDAWRACFAALADQGGPG